MKKLFILAILTSISLSFSYGQSTNKLIIKVDEVKSNEGTIKVSLFNSEESFLNKSIKEQILKAETGELTVEFTGLKIGEYTVSVIHDVNNNGQLDKNFMGIPNEPYGISMEGKSNFGPPNYEDAIFTVQETEQTIVINL